MSKLKKKLAILTLTIVTVYCGYYYVTHAGARDLTSEATDFTLTSKKITDEFTSNIELSNKKYLEKAVAISGKITSVSGLEVIIDHTIICNLKEIDASISENQKVYVKGRVVGYDDLMGELKLDQCFLVKG